MFFFWNIFLPPHLLVVCWWSVGDLFGRESRIIDRKRKNVAPKLLLLGCGSLDFMWQLDHHNSLSYSPSNLLLSVAELVENVCFPCSRVQRSQGVGS